MFLNTKQKNILSQFLLSPEDTGGCLSYYTLLDFKNSRQNDMKNKEYFTF